MRDLVKTYPFTGGPCNTEDNRRLALMKKLRLSKHILLMALHKSLCVHETQKYAEIIRESNRKLNCFD